MVRGQRPGKAFMKKNFVLDTNVLLHDPASMFAFAENNVVIPIYVIEEIDNFKKDLSELGRNARQVSRNLDELRGQASLVDGVPIGDQGGILRVGFATSDLPLEYTVMKNSPDNRILATALEVKKQDPNTLCIFISKDINLRIRAAAIGIPSDDYAVDRAPISELYSGSFQLEVSDELIQEAYEKGTIETPVEPEFGERLPPNSFAVLHSSASGGSVTVRVQPEGDVAKVLKGSGPRVWGITPRSPDQQYAFDLLLDERLSLVTLVGKAGTGKTLLAIAAGLQKTVEEEKYQKLLVSRPIFPMGKDIGFLPGQVSDKLRPWMQPVHDNLELLLGLAKEDKKRGRSTDELFDMGMIHIEPLTYIRGRSIPRQFILVDEAQNLTPHEVKTIITRAGDNTKIVLTGDPYQIDNPYIDATNNGLVHVVNRFRGESISGHVTLVKGERSALAERAAALL